MEAPGAYRKANGMKIVVKSAKRKNAVKRKLIRPKQKELPSLPARLNNPATPRTNDDESLSKESNSNRVDEFDSFPEEEIPCDTLLFVRSMEQSGQCLFIPLLGDAATKTVITTMNNMIPAVLESQIYAKLESMDGEDSVATLELQTLLQTNRLRRLASPSTAMVALVEIRHYRRAIWDAHRNSHSSCVDPCITSWFCSQLSQWTRRTLSKEEMETSWNKQKQKQQFTINQVVDKLVEMKLLLPDTATTMVSSSASSFVFWLPQWGSVLSAITKAQQKVMVQIKRSHHKELSQATLKNQSLPGGLSGFFVTHTLVAQGKAHVVDRPSGKFIKLARNNV